MTGASETDAGGHLRRIARGGAIGLVGAVVSAASGFGLIVVVTNLFSKTDAGMLFAATSLFVVLVSLSALGTDVGLGRFILRYDEAGRAADIPSCLRAAYRPVGVLSAAIAIAILLLADPLAPLVGLDRDTGPTILRILAVAVPAAALANLSLAGTRAFGNMRITVFVDKIGRAVAQPALAALVAVAGGGIIGLTIGWSVPYLVSAAVAVLLFRRYLRRRAAITDLGRLDEPRAYHDVRREFWRFTWPRSIAQVSQMTIQRADIILIAALLSPASAAIYTAATRFVVLGQFGVQAIQQVTQPRFTQMIARRDHGSLREVYSITTAWSMALAWPIYFVIGCAPSIYLGLFGEGYRADGGAVVVLMMIAMLFAVFSGPVDTLLLMSGRSSTSLVNSITALVIDIGLCLLLIPRMGISGAALAWAVAVATRCALAMVQVYRSLGIHPFGSETGLVGLAAIACFAVPITALSLTGAIDLVTFFIAATTGGVVYVGLLYLGRHRLRLEALRAIARRRTAVPGG